MTRIGKNQTSKERRVEDKQAAIIEKEDEFEDDWIDDWIDDDWNENEWVENDWG